MSANIARPRVLKNVAVVIVTFNRKCDLEKTVDAFYAQAHRIRYLVVVDNASTDGTGNYLEQLERSHPDLVRIVRMPENTGGAGGFAAGVEYARELPVEWIFLSDDDARPRANCIEKLLEFAVDVNHVYGCTAVVKGDEEERLCWPAPVVRKGGQRQRLIVEHRSGLAESEQVQFLPFLGFMLASQRALKIRPPSASYFISGDDVEYSLRLRKAGAKLIQVRDSVMEHPAISRYHVSIGGRKISCLHMPAWRRRFDVRNRIWNARLSHGWLFGALAASMQIVRLLMTLFHQPDRGSQSKAYLLGIYEGLFTLKK